MPTKSLHIAFCLPEFEEFKRAVDGKPADAAYLLQYHIARHLCSRGHQLTYLAAHGLGNTVCTRDLQRPVLARRTWSKSRWFDLASKASWRVQQRLGAPYLNVFSNLSLLDACVHCLPGHDLAFERNSIYRSGVALACRRLKLPYVLFMDADDILELDYMGKPLTGMLRWRASQVTRNNLHAADRVICVSEATRARLITHWSIPQEKIAVLPNAVDAQQFRPCPEARPEIRALLGIGESPLIIFVGSFYPWHDIGTLLHAFAKVLADRQDAHLVLVGDGQTRQSMMQRTVDLGVDQAVRFTGAVTYADVPLWIAAADIAVAPYPAMQQPLWLSPLKVFEYMASGTPVVASAAGQVADIVEDGRNGLLVPPSDVAAMTAALSKLIHDPGLRSKLGQQARLDALQRHSWEQYTSRMEQLFLETVHVAPA